MARITVEDCLDHMENRNRFHLSLMASRRARQLREGALPIVQSEEDDYTVLALREIATGQVTTEFLDRIDQELGGGEDRAAGREPSAESVAEAAEALGADMATSASEPAAPGADEAAEPAGGEPEAAEETGTGEAADEGGEEEVPNPDEEGS
jgi:DNA-directed RNA polymerase subunit omega